MGREEGRGRGKGRGRRIGVTSRGSQESAIARARGAPRCSRRASMLPHGNGECARGVRTYGRFTIAVARSMRGSSANDRRAKTEEERPSSLLSAARYAATTTTTSSPVTRRAENIGGEWRTLLRAVAEDGRVVPRPGVKGVTAELCAGA